MLDALNQKLSKLTPKQFDEVANVVALLIQANILVAVIPMLTIKPCPFWAIIWFVLACVPYVVGLLYHAGFNFGERWAVWKSLWRDLR